MSALLRKGFLILFAVVALLLALGLALGMDALFAKALRAWGPNAFGGQPVDFADAELSLLGGLAGVRGFRAGSQQEPLLDLERGELSVSIAAALDGRVHVRNAELTGARLHFAVREDGTLAVDPGPPPAEKRGGREPEPRAEPLPPPEQRDVVQIVAEYWERIQAYRDYYDKYGGVLGGGGESEPAEKRAPARFPGKPDFVAAAQAADQAARGGRFYLERAAIADFRWESMDRRTGKAILPELKSFTFALERVGGAPAGVTEPAVVRGAGELTDGGTVEFALSLARTKELSTLELRALGLPADAIFELVKSSLPFRLAGGRLDLEAPDLRFDDRRLRGKIRVTLAGAKVLPKKTSPQVLGVEPREFCRLLNDAMERAPVAFAIVLGGSPTRPTFDVENETDLGELLGGAVKAEAERRAKEFVDDKKEELQRDLLEKAGAGLGGEAGGLLDRALGGDPPEEKPKSEPKPKPKPKPKD